MSTDVHAFLEVKRYSIDDENREDGVWVSADKWTVDPNTIFYPEEAAKRLRVQENDRIYNGQNYYLFAVLAGVRNQFNLKPISQPKGLPFGVSPEVKEESDHLGTDGHSHSYVTLKELMNYDWDKEIDIIENVEHRDGVIAVVGETHSFIEPNDYALYITKRGTIREAVGNFMNTINQVKWYLQEDSRPYKRVTEDDIRLVFWFDN